MFLDQLSERAYCTVQVARAGSTPGLVACADHCLGCSAFEMPASKVAPVRIWNDAVPVCCALPDCMPLKGPLLRVMVLLYPFDAACRPGRNSLWSRQELT